MLQLQKELERAEAEEKRLREEREKLIKEQDEKMRQLELREKVCIISALPPELTYWANVCMAAIINMLCPLEIDSLILVLDDRQ